MPLPAKYLSRLQALYEASEVPCMCESDRPPQCESCSASEIFDKYVRELEAQIEYHGIGEFVGKHAPEKEMPTSVISLCTAVQSMSKDLCRHALSHVETFHKMLEGLTIVDLETVFQKLGKLEVNSGFITITGDEPLEVGLGGDGPVTVYAVNIDRRGVPGQIIVDVTGTFIDASGTSEEVVEQP